MSKYKKNIKHPCKTPGFSIGYRFPREYETPTPGPLHYKDVNLYPLNRGPRIGNEKRDISFISGSEGPGPGAYNINLLTETRSLSSIRRGSRSVCAFNSSTDRSPLLLQSSSEKIGPGQYDVLKEWTDLPDHKMNPTFSTFVSAGVYPSTISPGPAAYDVLSDWAAKIKPTKSGTMGFSKRDFLNLSKALSESLSGPTYFKYNNPEENSQRPGGVIGTGERIGLEKVDPTPGPGEYPINRSLEKSRSYQSFSSAPRTHFALSGEQTLNPGPGEYENRKEALTRIGTKFGRAPKRGLEYQSPTKAGPGAYEYQDSFRELTKKKNLEVERIRRAILIKKYTKTPLFASIQEKIPEKINDESILSQHKDLSMLTKRSKSPKAKKEREKPSFIDEIVHNSSSPGPIYNVEYNTIEGTAGQFGSKMGFGDKNSYLPNKRDIPGPASYKINRDLISLDNTNPNVGKAPRTTLVPENAKHIPGVGHYDVKEVEMNKGVIFSRAKRLVEKRVEKREKTELEKLLERN